MDTVTSIDACAIPRDQLRPILAGYLALDRARRARRRLVSGFGWLAVVALAVDAFIHVLPLSARWSAMAVIAIPPAWAWVRELRVERWLMRQLDGASGALIYTLSPSATPRSPTA